jgi:hypothetical protein
VKVFFSVLTVALTLTGYGCSADRGPATPLSPSSTGQDRNPAGESWRLTTTIVSLEGTACFWTRPVGAKADGWILSIERNGPQVRFLYDVNNPSDNTLFVGTVNEQSFTAASDTYHGWWSCSGNVAVSSSVIGSFSSDGRTLSGRERQMYRADGGSVLIVTLDWNATPV